MTQPLTIEIVLDRKAAAREAKAFRADQQKLNQQLLSDAEVQQKAETELVRQTNREKVKAAVSAKTAAVDSFTATTLAIEGVKLGVGALRGLVDGLAQSYARAGAKSRELAGGFSQQREGLGQLANLMNRPADDQFALDIARYNKKVGFRPEEGRAFLENLYNAGAQYKGSNISNDEFDELAVQSGQLALAKKVDPAIIADLVGRQIGFKDYSKFGKGASEQVLADVNRAFAIGSSGIGDDSQLAQETAKLAASSVNEDELRGVFREVADAEKLVSVLTEGFPMGQAEAGGGLLRAIRGFHKKQGKFLKAAGVTPEDDPFAAVEKIGRHAETLAKQGPAGTSIQDVIKANIPDELGSRALAVAYNKGVVGGLFAKRDKVGQDNAGPAAAQGVLDAFLASPRGQARAADADVALAQAERGAENSEVETLRKQAYARLVRDKKIDTNGTNFNDWLNGKASFGLVGDAEQKRIDDEVQRTLIARSPRGTAPGGAADLLNVSPLAREEELRARIGRIRAAGGDPLGRRPGEEAQIGEMRDRWTPQNLFHALAGEDGGFAAPGNAAAPPGGQAGSNPGIFDQMIKILGAIATNTAPKAGAPRPLVAAPPVRTR